MKNSRLPFILLAIGCGGFLLTVGCNSATKRKWLTTFFDGVPPEHPPTNTVVAAAETNQVAAAASKSASPAPAENYYAHPPFSQEKCSSCHASQFGQAMKKQAPELCWDCHKDFLATMKVKHQPVENGECKSCHDPHQASNTNLLVKIGKDLCLDCHDPPVNKGKSKHQPAENGECLACHNPHAAGQKGLLVKAEGKLCFDCHDVLEKQLQGAK